MNDKIYVTGKDGNLMEYNIDDIYGDIPNFSSEENDISENLKTQNDDAWFESRDVYITDEDGFIVRHSLY